MNHGGTSALRDREPDTPEFTKHIPNSRTQPRMGVRVMLVVLEEQGCEVLEISKILDGGLSEPYAAGQK